MPLTSAVVAVTTQLWPIGRRPVELSYYGKGLVTSRGREGLPTVTCVRLLCSREGAALYRRLCSVWYTIEASIMRSKNSNTKAAKPHILCVLHP